MNIKPISIETHRKWHYRGLNHYLHTKKDAVVPIVIAEIGRLVSTNPIIFLEENNKVGLYSLQGLLPNNNLMINEQGIWLGDYIPARYRSLPFVLASNSEKKNEEEKILCYLDDLNCVAEKFDVSSTPLFDDAGILSENMKRVFEFLQSIENNEVITQNALSSINKADLLEDWTIALKLTDGEKKMTGLKRINITKLKALPAGTLEDLNKSGGLDVCFASHLSLNNIEKLKQIVIDRSSDERNNNQTKETKSLREQTLEKQKKVQKEEMDILVKDLLLDDEI